jgi:hypothetical protein
VIWGIESNNGMFYTVAVGKRNNVAILRRDATHAQITADALNGIDFSASLPPGWDEEIALAWDRVSGAHPSVPGGV